MFTTKLHRVSISPVAEWSRHSVTKLCVLAPLAPIYATCGIITCRGKWYGWRGYSFHLYIGYIYFEVTWVACQWSLTVFCVIGEFRDIVMSFNYFNILSPSLFIKLVNWHWTSVFLSFHCIHQSRTSSNFCPTLVDRRMDTGWLIQIDSQHALTKVFVLDWGDVTDVSFDQKVEVWDDDEGRGQAGPWVVLHYQIVTLKLPVGVTALLYFGESVAVDSKLKSHYAYTDSFNALLFWVSMMYNIKYNCSCLKSFSSVELKWITLNASVPEHSNE